MHELPKDLTNSLRSYRGSIYGASRSSKVTDLEKGPEDYGEKQFERALNPTQSSLILHPTKSRYALSKAYQMQGDDIEKQDHQASSSAQQKPSQTPPQPKVETNAVSKRQATISPQTPGKTSFFSAPPVADIDPAASRLDDDETPLTKEHFYELVGMKPPTDSHNLPRHLATEHGLYMRVLKHMEYVQAQYRFFAIFVYIFLGLQIVISAMFIVLGSLTRVDTHIPIVILGAISTVIGGILALMQGQGLPNRLRQGRDALRTVIFEAEELYWDVNAGRNVLYKDVKKLREDYLRVLDEMRKNHPDTWNSTSNAIAQGPAKNSQKRGRKA